jgi:single-strand DNA-binding protein
MADLNELRLIGELGRDVEVRTTQSGKTMALVVIKTVTKNYTTFHRCTAWEDMAEAASDYKEGDRVQVTARLQSRSYEKDGKKVYVYEPVIVGLKDAEDAKTAGKGKRPQKVEDDDGVPF